MSDVQPPEVPAEAPAETPVADTAPEQPTTDPNTGEIDYSAGGEAAPRDNSEQEAEAPATAAQGEVDFTAEGGVHEPTGDTAKIQAAKSRVEAAFGEFSAAVQEFLGHVQNAVSKTETPEVSDQSQGYVTSVTVASSSPTPAPSGEPVAPTTEPPAQA